MAVSKVKTTQEISYDFGVVNKGVVFDLINIGHNGSATVVVIGSATLILPAGTYEEING